VLGSAVYLGRWLVFAGKLDRSRLGFAERAAVRGAHASEGDHRDRQAIDDWAAAIARELGESRVVPAGP
jgi:menaquinone-dependent protoporphyrinogen oxidase